MSRIIEILKQKHADCDGEHTVGITCQELTEIIAAFAEAQTVLGWFVSQCQGDSGTGETYWEQFPEYQQAKAIIKNNAP